MLAEGGIVTILNRTIEKGERLAKDLESQFMPLSEEITLDCDILINTTSLGMSPHTDTTPVSSDKFENSMVVMDIVYNPLETRLLRMARARGCLTVNGLGMFIHQGAEQFRMWTGFETPIDTVTRVVTQALRQTA